MKIDFWGLSLALQGSDWELSVQTLSGLPESPEAQCTKSLIAVLRLAAGCVSLYRTIH